MSNNIVIAVCDTLQQQSVAAFRFNFRGVGGSGGSFGQGLGEQEDVKAAVDYIISTPYIDTAKIGLSGYSFGGGVAAQTAVQDERINALALVSPTLSEETWAKLERYKMPQFFIVGENDSFVSSEKLRERVQGISAPVQSQVIPSVDHFWWGYEAELAQRVADFFISSFGKS